MSSEVAKKDINKCERCF